MTLSLLLPWFPILLTVGVGGRLLGRGRGFALGLLGALFWVAVLQATAGRGFWLDGWAVATVLTGATAIIAMGGWAGESEQQRSDANHPPTTFTSNETRPLDDRSTLPRIVEAFDEFEDWLEQHGQDPDPWTRFDELIRSTLYRFCRATHVRPYRLPAEADVLMPLREPAPGLERKALSARTGVIGHVVTTGRTFYAGDRPAVDGVSDGFEAPTWCFAIRQGRSRGGVVVVGQLDLAPQSQTERLAAAERLITHFWCRLVAHCEVRQAHGAEPITGLPTRDAFLRNADAVLKDSQRQGEPVALVVLAVEGLRDLADAGRWEASEEVLRAVGQALRRKVRSDDCLGRFDGSRMLWLLRRVDAALAELIIGQMVARVREVCDGARASVRIRCGVAGSGSAAGDLRGLLSRALAQWRRAHDENRSIAIDFPAGATPIPPTERSGTRKLAETLVGEEL